MEKALETKRQLDGPAYTMRTAAAPTLADSSDAYLLMPMIKSVIQNYHYPVSRECSYWHDIKGGVRLLLTYLEENGLHSFGKRRILLISELSDLHDLGKLIVPLEILSKPDKLRAAEWEMMKRHTVWGKQLIDWIELPDTADNREVREIAGNLCLYHHERWDGQGYPYGLAGDDIPMEAQVASIIDAYDSLRKKRAYKSDLSHQRAVQMILSGQCGQFSPMLLVAFSEIQDQLKAHGAERSKKEGLI